MFCIQCGTQLPEGAKFCHTCGKQIQTLVESNGKHVEETNSINRICKIFDKYFTSSDLYGENFYIRDEFGEDDIEFLQDDIAGEKGLVMFFYYDTTDYGLLVTDKRILIYGRRETQIYRLDRLKTALPGKEILADVMYLETIDNGRSMPIYLTGINNVKMFQAQFMHFVEEVYFYYHPSQNNSSEENSKIGKVCLEKDFDSIYFESGNPLDARSSKKYYKAISNFIIQNNEKIYTIYDATITGSCKEGFALCTTGIYGRDSDKRMMYYSWEDFKNVEYKRTLLEFKIGKHGFNVTEQRKVIELFDTLKKCL